MPLSTWLAKKTTLIKQNVQPNWKCHRRRRNKDQIKRKDDKISGNLDKKTTRQLFHETDHKVKESEMFYIQYVKPKSRYNLQHESSHRHNNSVD